MRYVSAEMGVQRVLLLQYAQKVYNLCSKLYNKPLQNSKGTNNLPPKICSFLLLVTDDDLFFRQPGLELYACYCVVVLHLLRFCRLISPRVISFFHEISIYTQLRISRILDIRKESFTICNDVQSTLHIYLLLLVFMKEYVIVEHHVGPLY